MLPHPGEDEDEGALRHVGQQEQGSLRICTQPLLFRNERPRTAGGGRQQAACGKLACDSPGAA